MVTRIDRPCRLESSHSIQRRIIHAALGVAVLGFAAVEVAAADEAENTGPARLPEVVVTATRIPTRVDEVASSMSIITAEDIERKQYRTVDQALRSLPSLGVVRSGGPGKTTAVFSRGTNANQTLVLIDGIEINDPSTVDGRADLSGIQIDDVERIEVLYGSQGTLYGSDAIGAVINIITKRGSGPPAAAAYAEGGSFTTLNQGASLRGGDQRYHYSFNAQHQFVGGLSATPDEFAPPGGDNDDDRYRNLTVSGKLGLALNGDVELNVAGRYVTLENELDFNVFPVQSDDDSESEADEVFLRGDARVTLFDGVTDHRFGVAYTRYDRVARDDRDPDNPDDFLRDANVGTRLKFDLQNDLHIFDNHVVTVGLETEEESIDSDLSSDSAFGPFSAAADAAARNNAVYLQDQVSYGGRVFGTLGVRLDDHEDFGSEVTWRIAPAYLHRETGTKVKGSYSTGFKAPSLFQLFGTSISSFGVFAGNPDLEPEESETWEVGLEQSLWADRLTFGATYYDTTVTNLIQGGATTNENIGRASLSGVEAFARARLADNLAVAANYAYTRPKNEDTGNDLLRRPRHKAQFDVDVRPLDDLTFSMEGILVGRRLDVDAVTFETIETPAYFLLNLFAAYSINQTFQAYARIENALDRDFEEPDGFAQPGIGGFVGLKARF